MRLTWGDKPAKALLRASEDGAGMGHEQHRSLKYMHPSSLHETAVNVMCRPHAVIRATRGFQLESSWTRQLDQLNLLILMQKVRVQDRMGTRTMAAMMTTDPSLHGCRKCTASTVAVTHGPRASVLALMPAHRSIQLSTSPPKQMPRLSVSAGITIWCITTRVAAMGTAPPVPCGSPGRPELGAGTRGDTAALPSCVA